MVKFGKLMGNIALASALSSSPTAASNYMQWQKTKTIIVGVIIFLVVALLAYMIITKKKDPEKFSGFFHRSNLASTYWLNQPQVQHTFPDLGLQNPDHHDYFKNSCEENTPNNAEICRYHKHRFDPAQL